MSDVLGTALVLGGTFLAAAGYVLQKRAHTHLAPGAALTRSPVWLLGLACMIFSALLVVASSPFLDQSKQAPLGAATLVFNSLLATLVLSEKFLVLHGISTLVIIFGSVLAVSANGAASKTLALADIVALFDGACVAYSVLAAVALGGGAWWVERRAAEGPAKWSARSRAVLSVLAPAIGGACNGWVGYAVKATTTVAAQGDWGALRGAPFWVFVLLAAAAVFGQVRFLNAGLAFFSAQRTVPVFQCAVIISNSFAGIAYFHDMRVAPQQLAIFFLGAAVCTAGILLLLLQKDEGAAATADGARAAAAAAALAGGGEPFLGAAAGAGDAGLREWQGDGVVTEPLGAESAAAEPAGAAGSHRAAAGPLADARAASAAAMPAGGYAAARALDAGFVAQPAGTPFYLLEVAPLVRGALRRAMAGAAPAGARAGAGAGGFEALADK